MESNRRAVVQHATTKIVSQYHRQQPGRWTIQLSLRIKTVWEVRSQNKVKVSAIAYLRLRNDVRAHAAESKCAFNSPIVEPRLARISTIFPIRTIIIDIPSVCGRRDKKPRVINAHLARCDPSSTHQCYERFMMSSRINKWLAVPLNLLSYHRLYFKRNDTECSIYITLDRRDIHEKKRLC